MSFSSWNDRLLGAFFGDFAAGQQVRLCVSKDLLDSEFADLGGGDEFLRVVRRGPDWPAHYDSRYYEWNQPRTFFDRARGLYRQWKHQCRRHPNYKAPANDAPPYLPYLCVLCYAWTVEGDGIAGHNFYERLEEIYPNHGLNSQLGALTELWSGLQEWSDETGGRFGRFVVERLGEMQYVGIPKAQVILTASRIDRLPALFGVLGIAAGGQLTTAQLRDLLIYDEGAACYFLGGSIVGAISDQDAIGESALAQLLQHYEEWDGSVPDDGRLRDPGDHVAACAGAPVYGRLLLGLHPLEENEGWQPVVHAIIDDLPGGVVQLRQSGRSWASTLVDGIAGPFTGAGNASHLDGTFLLNDTPATEIGNWQDETEGERLISLRGYARAVRVLRWVGSDLVEQPSLPAEGDAYVLIHESAARSWESWSRAVSGNNNVRLEARLPQSGLPTGWRLSVISGLRCLSDADWAAFTGGADGPRARPRTVRLVGGARARRTGIRRTYLSYDLPKVVVEAEGPLTWNLAGARLDELPARTKSLPKWLTGFDRSGTRTYRVLLHADAAVVVATCIRNGIEIGRVSFGVVRDEVDAAVSDGGNLRLNKLGEPSASDGIVGSEAPAAASCWHFFDGPFTSWELLHGELTVESPCFIFSEWLAHEGHVSYSRARDFAAELLAARGEWIAPTRELRAQSLLGGLEIGVDSRGRWASVRAVPCSLSPLPLLRHKQYQFVLFGTPPRSVMRTLVTEAQQRGIAVEICPQFSGAGFGFQLARPRLCFLGGDLEEFRQLAKAGQVDCELTPTAWRLAEWSAALSNWSQTLNWFPEVGPVPEATYRPCEFLTKDGDVIQPWGTLKLGRSDDPVTRKHFSYNLVRHQDDRYQNSYVAQRAWATWFVHGDAMQGLCKLMKLPALEQIPIAYAPDAKDVVVPLELELPTLLARALVACSGLVPNVLRADEYAAYTDARHGFTPGVEYKGLCLGYRNVPREIADRVLQKVGAVPVIFPPLPELTL